MLRAAERPVHAGGSNCSAHLAWLDPEPAHPDTREPLHLRDSNLREESPS